MKSLASVLFTASVLGLGLLGACGGEDSGDSEPAGNGSAQQQPCAGPNTGEWDAVGVPGGLRLDADCSFRFDGADGCRSVGRYAAPISNASGTFQVSIESVSGLGGGCLPAGVYACAYAFQAGDFGLDCGGGLQIFTR